MAYLVESPFASIVLEATASLTSRTSLRLRYRLQNNSDQVLFIFSHLWSKINADGQYQVQPGMVNVAVSAERVVVSKAVVPVPEDMEVEKHYTPCMSRVGPHDSYEEELEIPVPLVPYTWYQAPWQIPAAAPEPTARPLYFALGYLVASPGYEETIRQVATSQGVAYFRNVDPEDQLLISSGPLLAGVDAIEY